ncbi:MAG TPA: NADH-quinone oxidoreductase subunit L [Cyanobacteria bacterium UBA8543]|nr:NADH-quinone oxidoreductase subunit L [Cyanobacteria bacterium UBA8543]
MDLTELLEIAEKERKAMPSIRVHCCTSTGCQASNAVGVKKRLEEAVKSGGMCDRIQVVGVGCLGLCGHGPIVEIAPEGTLYEKVTPEQADSIINAVKGGKATAQRGDATHPFFTRQLKIVQENSGKIDPERIEEYIAVGGYQALYHVLYEMTPSEVVDEVTCSGLRARGGTGYPTGLEWATVANMPSGQKFVICNADEGDPGAFIDRSVLESDPQRVIEGMAIAGYAVGATQGYIYVRAEYPLAIRRLQKAIQQAKKLGILGTEIFGLPFDFHLDIRVGAGAFVCGEETPLISFIEGDRGTPRLRPTYPAESGLWDAPTLINNVETYANIKPIITKGANWFASIGTEKSKGTKVFCLTGKIRNTGLIEVPMGISVREIVEEIGGGVPNGSVKAVQTGGPSGGCIPVSALDTSVDYESLAKLGSIMGSGGLVIMDQNTSMVDVARFYIEFSMDESGGKCLPCRVGTVQMYRLLTKISEGKASLSDLEQLEELCDMIKNTSLCGLGQSAPNPVLSTLEYFRDEYLALINTTARASYFWERNGQSASD